MSNRKPAEVSMAASVDRAVPAAHDPRGGPVVLTVIVPVYNEAETISELLRASCRRPMPSR